MCCSCLDLPLLEAGYASVHRDMKRQFCVIDRPSQECFLDDTVNLINDEISELGLRLQQIVCEFDGKQYVSLVSSNNRFLGSVYL